jgi:UDP-glucose 4-epimerase
LKSRVLITGGAGFIGSHLVDEFISRGERVTVLDDLSTGTSKNLEHLQGNPNLEIVTGSILDKSIVDSLVSKNDGCLHMAAAVGVKKILNDPIGSLNTNINGSENVLFSSLKHKKRVLIASTSEIYGKNTSEVLTEESDRILGSPLLSRWTYSEAKAIEEAIAYHLHRTQGLNLRIVRLFNTVGPRQSSAYGMVIPKFFDAVLNDREIEIHGEGTQRRVFCHVADAVSGILAIWDCEEANGEAFNVGGKEEIEISKLAAEVMKVVGKKVRIRNIPYEELRKEGFEDMPRRVPSTEKLQKLTGWQPKRGLAEILNDFQGYLVGSQ